MEISNFYRFFFNHIQSVSNIRTKLFRWKCKDPRQHDFLEMIFTRWIIGDFRVRDLDREIKAETKSSRSYTTFSSSSPFSASFYSFLVLITHMPRRNELPRQPTCVLRLVVGRNTDLSLHPSPAVHSWTAERGQNFSRRQPDSFRWWKSTWKCGTKSAMLRAYLVEHSRDNARVRSQRVQRE